ncbi:unnamed protein product [Closterium sp. NIES-53]
MSPLNLLTLHPRRANPSHTVPLLLPHRHKPPVGNVVHHQLSTPAVIHIIKSLCTNHARTPLLGNPPLVLQRIPHLPRLLPLLPTHLLIQSDSVGSSSSQASVLPDVEQVAVVKASFGPGQHPRGGIEAPLPPLRHTRRPPPKLRHLSRAPLQSRSRDEIAEIAEPGSLHTPRPRGTVPPCSCPATWGHTRSDNAESRAALPAGSATWWRSVGLSEPTLPLLSCGRASGGGGRGGGRSGGA